MYTSCLTAFLLLSITTARHHSHHHRPKKLPTGKLPATSQFSDDQGTKWSCDYVGELAFTGTLQKQGLGGDKCRTSKLGDQVIWNCGDMECGGDYTVCGFSMGPAFYGTSSVMKVDTNGISNVDDNTFLEPWSGDEPPQSPQTGWGMDTTNVAHLNDTTGVAFAWEIWRGASDGSIVNRGNAAAAITLGKKKPQATRLGPLLSGPDAIQLGLLAIVRHEEYVYTYSIGGPSNIIVGRVKADDSVFDASQHEFLMHGSTTDWASGFPNANTTDIGATTSNSGGQFGCGVYGSAFYSNYLQQFVIICGIYMNYVNMYTSDTPYGPWSAEYGLLDGSTNSHAASSYGPMVHKMYSPGGSDQTLYFSMGPNGPFNMFKLEFHY